MITEILIQLGVGLLGILIYNVFKFQKFLRSKEIRNAVFWQSYWQEMKFNWLWCSVMLLLLSITLKILPDSIDAIKTFTGLDIGTSIASFFSLGIGLSSVVDTKTENL